MKVIATVDAFPAPSVTVTLVVCVDDFVVDEGVTANALVDDGVTVTSVGSAAVAENVPLKPVSLAVKLIAAFPQALFGFASNARLFGERAIALVVGTVVGVAVGTVVGVVVGAPLGTLVGVAVAPGAAVGAILPGANVVDPPLHAASEMAPIYAIPTNGRCRNTEGPRKKWLRPPYADHIPTEHWGKPVDVGPRRRSLGRLERTQIGRHGRRRHLLEDFCPSVERDVRSVISSPRAGSHARS